MTIDQATLRNQIKRIISHQKKAPVEVLPIAEEFGLKVYRANNWPDDASGMIKKNEDGIYEIYTNAKHHSHRRRFTIAHEIAHYVLHRDEIGDGIVDDALYRSSLSSRQETEANDLAAHILMPWELLVKEINQGIDDIGTLAEIFKVSKSAMSIRLKVPFEAAKGRISLSEIAQP